MGAPVAGGGTEGAPIERLQQDLNALKDMVTKLEGGVECVGMALSGGAYGVSLGIRVGQNLWTDDCKWKRFLVGSIGLAIGAGAGVTIYFCKPILWEAATKWFTTTFLGVEAE